MLRLCAARGIWQRQLASTRMCRGNGDRGGPCCKRRVVIHVDLFCRFGVLRFVGFQPRLTIDRYDVLCVFCIFTFISYQPK